MDKRQGIIFDLDGTLWEVIDATYESANIITQKHNIEEVSKETICKVFGMNKVDATKTYFPNVDLNKGFELMDEISEVLIKRLREYGGNLYPEIENTIKRLSEEYDLFIVSNSGETAYIEAFLISSGLGKYFKDYIAASKIGITKAEGIRKIMKDNDIKEAVYVGDTTRDKEAAVLANVIFIHAKYGFGKNIEANYSIEEIKELPDVVTDILT